ncbi:MAG: pyridoxal phosphate-dependent aminotransferase [Rhodobacteraceae bacterium]|nr:pyridoxal phosphate-dependent aminotransferase [Paracoccaceae bacterium]
MARDPRLTRLVSDLPATVPFVGPEAQERERGKRFTARLGANESVFGPSPRAVAAIEAAARDVWMYGDPETHDLRHALAAHHGIEPEAIVIGEGIDGLLGTLARLLVEPGDPVVTSLGAYPTFAYHVRAVGGALTCVPYRDDHEDPDALAAAARENGAKLVYLANPDNPMGTCLSAGTIQTLIEALPDDCLLALDEAYADFAPAGAVPLMDTGEARVIRLRTFSKAHGLAGLRVGYAIGEPILIRAFERIRNHFGVGRLAQAAALAALKDTEWMAHVQGEVAQARDRIAAIAEAVGLTPLPSATNFVAIDCGGDGDRARAVLEGLLSRGIFVRMPGVPPLDRCIRVTAGRPGDLDRFADALTATLAEL